LVNGNLVTKEFACRKEEWLSILRIQLGRCWDSSPGETFRGCQQRAVWLLDVNGGQKRMEIRLDVGK
jgi:hypothetical protein